MEVGQLTVQLRTDSGKSAVRKLRNQGHVPGVCYGPGSDPLLISLEAKALQKALDPVKGRNTLLRMKVQGAAASVKEVAVLVQDIQRDAIRGDLTHVDFLKVDVTKPVRVVIPIVVTGKSAGVVAGGYLHLEHRTLPLLALPEKIPTKIEVDVTSLEMGEAIHVSDLKLSEGLTPLFSPGTTICVVSAPKEEKAESASAQGSVETAAGTADAKKTTDTKDAKAPTAKAAAKGK